MGWRDGPDRGPVRFPPGRVSELLSVIHPLPLELHPAGHFLAGRERAGLDRDNAAIFNRLRQRQTMMANRQHLG